MKVQPNKKCDNAISKIQKKCKLWYKNNWYPWKCWQWCHFRDTEDSTREGIFININEESRWYDEKNEENNYDKNLHTDGYFTKLKNKK